MRTIRRLKLGIVFILAAALPGAVLAAGIHHQDVAQPACSGQLPTFSVEGGPESGTCVQPGEAGFVGSFSTGYAIQFVRSAGMEATTFDQLQQSHSVALLCREADIVPAPGQVLPVGMTPLLFEQMARGGEIDTPCARPGTLP